MKLRLHRIFICQSLAMLRNVQQRELRLSPFEQHGVPFPLVVAESDIFPVNVPVARFQLPYQLAFGVSLTAQQLRRTHIESQRAKQNLSKPQHYPKNIVFYSVNHSVIG